MARIKVLKSTFEKRRSLGIEPRILGFWLIAWLVKITVRWFVVTRGHKGAPALQKDEVAEWDLGCGCKGGCAAVRPPTVYDATPAAVKSSACSAG